MTKKIGEYTWSKCKWWEKRRVKNLVLTYNNTSGTLITENVNLSSLLAHITIVNNKYV